MVADEKVLEELYELLTLYFSIVDSVCTGPIHVNSQIKNVESSLDKVIFQKEILARITTLIIAEFVCNSKGEESWKRITKSTKKL